MNKGIEKITTSTPKNETSPEQKKLEEIFVNFPDSDLNYWKTFYTKDLNSESEYLKKRASKLLNLIEEAEKISAMETVESNSAPEQAVEEIVNSTPVIIETQTTIPQEEDNIPETQEVFEQKQENEIKIEDVVSQEVAIVTNEQPEHVIIEKIIENSISEEEKQELKKEFPGENIEEKIEKEVVKELNIKKEQPLEKESLSILGIIRKKLRRTFLLLMAVGTFEVVTSFSNAKSADAISYDKFKIENLKDWEKIELDQEQINNLDNISIINKANENSTEKYLVVDKQNGKTLLYEGASFLKSYNVCLGDSIGDQQTILKSAYKKNLAPIGRDEEGEMMYETQDVSIEEATYVKDGERYLKEGYDAWTDWGTGNMKTGAGIYEVSNKGPFLKDVGLFLKNERGAQVATSLHYNSHFEKESASFRSSNGCVGFYKKDIREIYESMPIGAKVYILPDNPHNRFKIIDGELRFVSNEKNVNRTIRPYEAKPIILKAENVNDDGKEFLTILANNKKDIMKLYPTVSNDVYNEVAKIAYGIFGQESSFGTYGLVTGKLGQMTDLVGTIIGKNVSVGETQVRITSISQKVRDAFDIKKTSDLYNHKKGAIATVSVLLDAYVNAIPNSKKDDYKKLLPLFYNSPNRNFKNALKNGKANYDYSNKVLKHSNKVKVYMQNR